MSYEEFVTDGVSLGRRPELVGGGLIRSLGGWSQVMSLRRKGMGVSSDGRILRNTEFVENLLAEADERETLRLAPRARDLGELAKEITEGEGLLESELRSGSRRRKVSNGRRLFCQLAVGKMGYPGAEVARFLGVTTSAGARAAHSEDSPEIRKYL